MTKRFWQWDSLWEWTLAPHVDPAKLEQCLQQSRAALPLPVLWLLGKAQAGKTSLIRALTGSTAAEIGNGFRPCTRSARLYPFPDPQNAFLQFLDTRGLGEVAYDPGEDMRVLEKQAHLVIVVVKAMDHAQQCVLDPLHAIHQSHPKWPILVVQTALHEGYPTPGSPHRLPYPFDGDPLPGGLPADLVRSLAAQRAWFAGMPVRFVAVDFTLPEDGYQPEDYGLEALWTAIEDTLPLGLRAMLQQTPQARQPLRDAFFDAAHPQVVAHALVAGAMGALPPPFDLLPIVAILAKMFHAVASVYGQPPRGRWMMEFGSTLGTGTLARYLIRLASREPLKLLPVPGIGSVAGALFAAASTYALGLTLCAYFSYIVKGDVPDAAALRKLYNEQYREGRRLLGAYLKRVPAQKEAPP
jgi:uncharacterized protein (DUF697 family)